MTIRNILDLRKKEQPKVILVEKVVFKKRSFFSETLRVFVAIVIVSVTVWGITQAQSAAVLDDSSKPSSTENLTGIYGTVVSMSGDSLELDDTKGSKYEGVDVFNVNLKNIKTVETNDDIPVQISVADIKTGDLIIARGIIDGNSINAYDVISFSYKNSDLVATSTATTTPIDALENSTSSISSALASSTSDITNDLTGSTTQDQYTVTGSTSTKETSSGTSSPSVIDNILNSISNTTQNVFDALTGGITGSDPSSVNSASSSQSTQPDQSTQSINSVTSPSSTTDPTVNTDNSVPIN